MADPANQTTTDCPASAPRATHPVFDLVQRLRHLDVDYEPSHCDEAMKEAAYEIVRLRAIVRVNGLRWGHTHAEVDAILQEQRHG